MPTRRCPSTTTTTWLAIAVLATTRSSAAQSTGAAITGVGTLLSGSGSSAGRGLALGVLLASPHLAAARPFGAANTSVAATRRKLGYAMTDSNIRTAVAAWLSDATAAEATYGHISTLGHIGGDGHVGVVPLRLVFQRGHQCVGYLWRHVDVGDVQSLVF